ncbi:MAG: phenylalanine--tRNA ligase subunit beta [Sulfolobaceae archaeon]
MVTIVLSKRKLLDKLGLNEHELEDILFNLKSEIKPVDENNLEIEINADRLDLLTTDGIARAVKGLLGKELGEAKYKVTETDYTLVVHNVKYRPYALAAIVYNVNIDLQELIQFQEKLHQTIGRKRKKVAIGFHDLSKIDSKIIEYREIPLNYKFIPLNQNKEMSISEVIDNTEQGKLYGNISVSDGKSPAIIQDDGQVLSIPPIINSEKTKVTEKTKNLFIDVTGTSYEAVAQTLDIIVTNLAETGGIIGKVKVIKKIDQTQLFSPLLSHKVISTTSKYVSETLGITITNKTLCENIRKMRMDCVENEKVNVIVPPYRIDILNEIDIVEDVAMSIGYNNILALPHKPILAGYGSYDYISLLERKIRDLSIGANFTEIFSFTLIKDTKLLEKEYVKIVNPISEEFNAVRNSLIPVLLDFLSKNQHARLPIRIFEIGDIVIKSQYSDTNYSNEKRAGFAIMDDKVSYEDIQAPIHYILSALGIEPRYKEVSSKFLIEGRAANIVYENEIIGILGETNLYLLRSLGIEYPIAVAEIYLTRMYNILKKMNNRRA